MEPLINIIIPTYNRAHLITRAVEAVLGQSYHKLIVTVVDDGSTDDTGARLRRHLDDPRLQYIRLTRNVGTAKAKNIGLALVPAEACSFHDSDDLPHRDKVLRQARILAQPDIRADECLDWAGIGRDPGARIDVGCVLVVHELLLPDGRRELVTRSLSLVDDIFPNLQMGSTVPGDWTHINSGLFRSAIFARLGGFADCIEEDREFRNRLIFGGELIWIIQEPLLTKIETPDSLTQSRDSDYDSARRKRDRRAVWEAVARWKRTGEVEPVPIDLSGVEIAEISNPDLLGAAQVLATSETRQWVTQILDRFGAGKLPTMAGGVLS